MNKRIWITALAAAALIAVVGAVSFTPASAQEGANPDLEALGKALFFDPNLSVNRTQSCADCHAPETGFVGESSDVNLAAGIYQGALLNHFGNRKPPTSNYAGESPNLYFDEETGKWVGGMFYDGRATGWTLGDPLAEQAQGPFLNPLEQALPNARLLVQRVAKADYAGLFEQVWGAGALKNVDLAYEQIGRSIAAYERSAEVNPFSSKFDQFWDTAKAAGKDVTLIRCPGGGIGGGGEGGGMQGMGCGMPGMGGGAGMNRNFPNNWTQYRNLGLTDDELIGLAIFNDVNRADCASCHTLDEGAEGYPLFTNFAYENIGIPKNPDNPFYSMPPGFNPAGAAYIDYGLGEFLESAGYPPEVYESELGKFKTPTLRNVDMRPTEDFVKAYGHNGVFKSLDEVVLFYSWRTMIDMGACEMMGGGGMGPGMGPGPGGMTCEEMMDLFDEPEVDLNRTIMNHFPMMQVDFVTAFLRTLTDGVYIR